jgi:hypothetical protein
VLAVIYQTPTGYIEENSGLSVQRIYEGPRAPWLISMPAMKMIAFGYVMLNALQARAVIDDFGDLVAVEQWR